MFNPKELFERTFNNTQYYKGYQKILENIYETISQKSAMEDMHTFYFDIETVPNHRLGELQRYLVNHFENSGFGISSSLLSTDGRYNTLSFTLAWDMRYKNVKNG